ncbi:MAG TPA: GNAT family N-acetyltransferase [Candidatus Limnocylindria bacterium]|nr:GNAT family N-acetyltransferase [Candidatus Limnocylindria bacterium]
MPAETAFARTPLRGAGLTFRPATLDDIPWTAAFQTAREPSEPANEAQLRHRWRSADPERVDDRWIVEEAGAPVGYAYFGHPAWEKAPMRAARVLAWFADGPARPERMGRAFDALEPYAVSDGTAIFMAGTREDLDDEYRALVARGYTEERRSKSWELDLPARRDAIAAMTAASRQRMRDEAIEITTIDQISDPDKWRKLHALCEASIQDIPTTVPHPPESFESFMQWMSSPGMHADRLWVAREGSAVVGMSVLDYPPGVGNVWTDYTGTTRPVRGRGIARALKCETVMQAIALGVTHVRTNNDGENKPILHLNEEMGYHRIPGYIQLLKAAPAR